MAHGLPDGPLDPHLFGEDQPCFGCSPSHPTGLRLRFAREGQDVVTRFVPAETHQGPPAVMHGGLVATLADEIAAWAVVALLGKFGFTAQFEGRLKAPVRIGREVAGRGRIEKETGGRTVGVRVELTQEGALVFTGLFTFVMLDQGAAEKMLGGPLPEAWKRFAR
jgi:acyl-coenzyme A thioesterase PaaI-like protein